MLSSYTLTHRLMRPRWCAIAKQVMSEDGQWDELKLPNSSAQVYNGLPCGTLSNNSLIDIVLPDGTLPSGTPSRKRARAACDGAKGSLNREPTSEADLLNMCAISENIGADLWNIRADSGNIQSQTSHHYYR
jgi:hypothetical protein